MKIQIGIELDDKDLRKLLKALGDGILEAPALMPLLEKFMADVDVVIPPKKSKRGKRRRSSRRADTN